MRTDASTYRTSTPTRRLPRTVQSVDRAAALLKASRPLRRRRRRAGAGRPLRHQPQHRLAAAVDAGGARAGRARPGSRSATRSATPRSSSRRQPSTTRSPAACARSSSGWRGHRRDRHACRGAALQPRLRRPGRPARAASAPTGWAGRSRCTPRPPARCSWPGCPTRSGGRAARRARALHRRTRSPTAAELEPELSQIRRDGYGICLGRVRGVLQRRVRGGARLARPAGGDRQRVGAQPARHARSGCPRWAARRCARRTRCRRVAARE